MTAQILTDWDSDKTAAFQKKKIVAHHNLHERDLFTDEGLIELLDAYPRENLGLYTMGTDPEGLDTFKAGNAHGVSGKDILDVVKRGRVWLNLRKADLELPVYAELRDDMFAEVDQRTGVKTRKQDLGVLISSPKVQIFFHMDIPLVLLWQVRGVKRVWLWDVKEPYVKDVELEGVVLRETEEEVPFDAAWDENATVVDLEPGMVATWPQFGPHRVQNHDVLNVSLSCEFQTMETLVRANALYANGVFRRNFGMNPTILNNSPAALYSKAFAARFFKILKLRKSFEYQIPRSFKIDPDAETGIRWLPEAA